MKLLNSVLFAAAAVRAATGVGGGDGPQTGELCGACPADGCDRDIWLECKNDRCVCIANWIPQDGKPGCMGFDTKPENAHSCSADPTEAPPTEKPSIPDSATLCGKCKDNKGCGGEEAHMYCHSEMRVCACRKEWGPNADTEDCSVKSPMEFIPEERCKDINPEVADEKCPPKHCEKVANSVCKQINLQGEIHRKCICMDGFEYDSENDRCVNEDDGKCAKNTDCTAPNEVCDKKGDRRCICRDGFMRRLHASGKKVCTATCGKYQKLEKPMDCETGDARHCGGMDMRVRHEWSREAEKYNQPQFCDANASCEMIDVFDGAMQIEACVCHDTFLGNGCECHNKMTCDDKCEAQMTGSVCIKNPDGPEFKCRCPKGTLQMTYNDKKKTPCCVTVPMCSTDDKSNCMDMGKAFCAINDGETEGMCECWDGLRMNKKGMCVEKDDYSDDDYEEEEEEDDEVIIQDPCKGVSCEDNAHCEVNKKREPMCVCDDEFTGKEGLNCIKPVEEGDCQYGRCYGSEVTWVNKPDFPNAMDYDQCGHDSMNLMCMKNGCCGCKAHWSDANNKPKDGCENRMSPCEGDTKCHPKAECKDIKDIKNEFDEDNSKPMGGKGRMADMEKPLEIEGLGYICQCPEGLHGDGIGKQGCAKPEELQINECMGLVNPCGRFSKCTDLRDGYECECDAGYVGKDGRRCVKPKPQPQPAQNPNMCDGFCKYSKSNPDCHLRDISSLHTKESTTDLFSMDVEADEDQMPGVIMKFATKKSGWALNRSKYTAFLDWSQVRCGNVLLGGIMSGSVKVSVFDKAGKDGKSVYRVDGVQGFLTKTKTNDRSWSGVVVQYSKIAKTLQDLTGDPEDLEENQEVRTLNDGSTAIRPNFDTVFIHLSGKEVSSELMGSKYKTCFDVRDGPPFKFVLWDDRTAESTGDTIEDRTHLVTLDENRTKCYLKYKSAGKTIADMVCNEPLVVNGEKVKDHPTMDEMINEADKNNLACTEQTEG